MFLTNSASDPYWGKTRRYRLSHDNQNTARFHRASQSMIELLALNLVQFPGN
jgi:hypothetical protein